METYAIGIHGETPINSFRLLEIQLSVTPMKITYFLLWWALLVHMKVHECENSQDQALCDPFPLTSMEIRGDLTLPTVC